MKFSTRHTLSVLSALAVLVCAALQPQAASAAKDKDPTTRLDVTTQPADATVRIDHQERGKAPLALTDLTPGPHLVQASKPGFEDAFETVVLELGLSRTAALHLEPHRLIDPRRERDDEIRVAVHRSAVHRADRIAGRERRRGLGGGAREHLRDLPRQRERPRVRDADRWCAKVGVGMQSGRDRRLVARPAVLDLDALPDASERHAVSEVVEDRPPLPADPHDLVAGAQAGLPRRAAGAVSYTHLTLPTILRV